MPGALVMARQRRWRVMDVEPGDGCAAIRLARLDGRGTPLSLLVPFDLLQPIERCERPRTVHRRAAAAACAAALRDTHPWAGLPTTLGADLRILDFQLEPALRLLRGECARLLLADEVGLGKTIQASVIVGELRARHEADRVLIATPAGLRDQWQQELTARCGLPVRRVDAATLASEGRALPPWIDYWSLPGIFLVSIDLIKRTEILAPLARAVWDVVVLDEAHHAAHDTERGAAAAALCARARYVILISATPHDGDAAAFDRLLSLGALAGDPTPLRVFRRTRAEAGLHGPVRRSRWIRVPPSPAERRMHERLERYTARVWRESADASRARLAMIVLRKRALSSPAALVRSAERRFALLDPLAPSHDQLPLAFDDLHGDAIGEDDPLEPELGEPGLRDRDDERRLLADLMEAGRTAALSHAKLAALGRALARTTEPVIIFTEYRDTLRHLAAALGSRASLVCLHGGLLPPARAGVIEAFVTARARVLLATDAAAEGLNLHRRCRWVIHFELPWSPVRLEQRTGRVDRIGQARPVHAWSLVSAGTAEERVLLRLDARQALSETEVARLVFGNGSAAGDPMLLRTRVGCAARDEARRLALLARLPAETRAAPQLRPVRCHVRPRGPFGRLATGRVTLFRALLADGAGRRVAAAAAALAAPRHCQSVDRSAARLLGRRLAASLPDARRFARTALSRAAAIESGLQADARRAVQQSLFDRRVAREEERARTAIARALEHLRRASARAAGVLAPASGHVQTIASFEIR